MKICNKSNNLLKKKQLKKLQIYYIIFLYIKTILGGAIKLFDSKEMLEIQLEYNGVRENIEDLFEIISELKKMQYFYLEEPNQIHDLLYHSIFCMEGIKNNKIYLKLAALLHDIGKLETKKYIRQ